MPILSVSDFKAWTAIEPTPPGHLGRWSRNIDLSTGRARGNRGFTVKRQVAAETNKPGASFLHRHKDGTEWPWYYLDTVLRAEQTDASIADVQTGLTSGYEFSHVNLASPLGVSVFFNGTNSESQRIRKDGTELGAEPFDLGTPSAPTVTAVGSGGSLPDGAFHVKVTLLEKDADSQLLRESTASAAGTDTISGGGGSGKLTVTEPTGSAGTTHWRVYMSDDGDVLGSYFQVGEFAKSAGTQDITTNPETTAIPQRNGSPQLGDIPLTGVNIAVLHLGRIFVASTTSNKLYWSERDSLQWYSTNELNNGAETNWNGHIRGMVSFAGSLVVFTTDSVHIIDGDFSRDSSGGTATFKANVSVRTLPGGLGCVSHRSISAYGSAILFMSNKGPATVRVNGVEILSRASIEDDLATWDWDNMVRCHGTIDQKTRSWCLAVPRKTNASRPQDGAATSGIPDTIYRLLLGSLTWNCPLRVETVDLCWRAHGTAGSSGNDSNLYAMGPHGTLLRLNHGWSGGVLDVSGTNYDGKLASSTTTTSADISLSGVSASDLIGQLVALYYPITDSNFPGVVAVRTISANTSGQVTWAGALTAPSGTEWTVRVAAWGHAVKNSIVLGELSKVKRIDYELDDAVGRESIS